MADPKPTTAGQRFNQFYGQFRKTDLYRAMANTREDSPWHREPNVAEHTRMLIEYYMDNFYTYRNEKQRMLSLIACTFHDVGKPPAQIIKHSEERGEYRAYHGHEQLSARMWVDYAMSNLDMVTTLLGFSLEDIANVAMMLEHHVPFGLKDKRKRKALKDAFMLRMGEPGHRAWLDLLLSDQHGRFSDDQAVKLAAVDVWIKEWEHV
jgi:hypothetical protein